MVLRHHDMRDQLGAGLTTRYRLNWHCGRTHAALAGTGILEFVVNDHEELLRHNGQLLQSSDSVLLLAAW